MVVVNEEVKKYDDGMIPVSAGAPFGFSEDVFEGDSYLWKVGDVIYISLIMVKRDKRGGGEFKGLVKRILEEGFEVRVPTPIGLMQTILIKWGFSQSHERGEFGLYEVWSKKGSLP